MKPVGCGLWGRLLNLSITQKVQPTSFVTTLEVSEHAEMNRREQECPEGSGNLSCSPFWFQPKHPRRLFSQQPLHIQSEYRRARLLDDPGP